MAANGALSVLWPTIAAVTCVLFLFLGGRAWAYHARFAAATRPGGRSFSYEDRAPYWVALGTLFVVLAVTWCTGLLNTSAYGMCAVPTNPAYATGSTFVLGMGLAIWAAVTGVIEVLLGIGWATVDRKWLMFRMGLMLLLAGVAVLGVARWFVLNGLVSLHC